MKYLILILLLSVNVFSLNKIVIPQRATPGSTITASKTNENLDTIASKVNKLIDSTEQKFVRFTDFKDSTIDSATIPVFKGNETHRGIVTHNDSTYFASGVRGSRLYFPQVDIDSMVGDVSIGGKLKISGGLLTLNGNAASTIEQETSPSIFFNSPSNYYYSIIKQDVDTLAFYTFYGNWHKRFGISGDGNAKFNGTVTTSTLNTGNGDNELYPMNQDVRSTASPTFAGITIAGGSQLTVYREVTVPCTVKTDCITVQQTFNATIERIGNVILLKIPSFTGTSNSNNLKIYCNISGYVQVSYTSTASSINVTDNGSYKTAHALLGFDHIVIEKDDIAGYATLGDKGVVYTTTILWKY